MKKFTTNFSGEGYRRSLRILRSIALGLVALVWANTATFAQTCPPPDGTVYFYADDVTACYSANNLYKVKVSVKDFDKLDSLHLVLDYNSSFWTFVGATVSESNFKQTNSNDDGSLTNQPMTITGGGGTVTFDWAELVARGHIDASMGAQSEFAELTFSLNNFPNNSLSVYSTDLEWNEAQTKVYHCGGGGGGGTTWTEWNGADYTDGSITTTVKYPTISYTLDPTIVACSDGLAQLTISSPVGADYKYSYNGQVSWSTEHAANLAVGSHTVQVQDAHGCLSNDTVVVVKSVRQVAFKVKFTPEKCSALGEINITAKFGNASYTYWVVPAADSAAFFGNLTANGEASSTLDQYRSALSQWGMPAGRYFVAVTDNAGCINLLDPASWKQGVIEESGDFKYDTDLLVGTVECPGEADGKYEISNIDGDSTYYYISVINGNGATVATVDSVEAEGSDTITGLVPGGYTVYVTDGVCTKSTTFTIKDIKAPTFYVDYTDASCEVDSGTVWVNKINDKDIAAAVAAGVDTTDWKYRVEGPNFNETAAIGDTMLHVPAAKYQVYLITNCIDEIPFYNSDLSGNILPVLNDGSITFVLDIKSEKCFGDNDGTIKVTNVTRSCTNCAQNANYQFRVEGGAWMDIDETFNATAQDTYLVEVRDSADPEVCFVKEDEIVSGPDAALTVVVSEVFAPTCKGGNDGRVKMVVSGGTEPYQYSVDNAPNWRLNMSFGLTEGEHTLRVMDANGCEWDGTVTIETLDPILITATLEDTIKCTGDKATINVTLDAFTSVSDSSKYKYYYSKESNDVAGYGNPFKPSFVGSSATRFAPGVYYIQAQDPNGCVSNEDTVVIEGVDKLEFELDSKNATCYGTWTGRVILNVLKGNPNPVYYYAYANKSAYFNGADVEWYPFAEGAVTDSIELQKGIYYFKVKDGCNGEEYSPIKVEIDGYDPIKAKVNIDNNVTCYGDNDGKITVTATGGAPGFGVEGAHYLYTLMQGGTVIGTALQTSNVFAGLPATYTAGQSSSAYDYEVYVYDTTDPHAEPAMCTPASQVVKINQPERLEATFETYPVTCAGAEDGEVHVSIIGGVGGTFNYKGNNNGAKKDKKAYKVTINNITGGKGYSLELADAQNEVVFQVYGGDFEVIVEDANGCSFIGKVTVLEPEPWEIKTWSKGPSDCGEDDGKIWASAIGGFDGEGISWKFEGGDVGTTQAGDTILLTSTAVYNTHYHVEANNNYITGQCSAKNTVIIGVFNPFKFDDPIIECVKCYGGSNGKVTISNITGGSGKYQIQLVGGDNPTYNPGDNSLWFPKKANGSAKYVSSDIVFNTLSEGEYWIYLRDDSGFTLENCCRPIKFEMCQPDSLELNTVTWISDVACAGDSTGAFSIQASGGTPPYTYGYTKSEGDSYPTNSIVWNSENDSIFEKVPAGTYIGWVRDANGCETGCEINAQGLPIDDHRVVIRETDALTFGLRGVKGDVCYGEKTDLVIYNVQGGSGATFTAEITGKMYDGTDTTYVFTDLSMSSVSHSLRVYASDSHGYSVSLITEAGCKSTSKKIKIYQLKEFKVDIVLSNSTLCVGDEEALIVFKPEGGSGNIRYDIYSDGELIRENSTIDNHVVVVGHEYVVVAKDKNAGCIATDTMMIEPPVAINFSIKDVSCYGDEKASVRINANGTPGRTFKAFWDELEGDVIIRSDSSSSFEETTDVLNAFIFDNENLNDVHYEFRIVDNMGCESVVDTLTFDKVQHPIALFVDVVEQKECSAEVTLNVTGGIDPYLVVMGDDTITNMTMELASGSHAIVITDTHLRCKLETTIDIESVPVVRDTTIKTYIDEKVQFVDADADLDTLIGKNVYHFTYTDATSSCERTLNVTVNEIPRPYTIAEVQGTEAVSPIDGKVAQITGTVTAVVDGEGFFVQDANAAWSGIWVAYSNVTTDGIQEGNGVVVVGVVGEIDNVTAITATSVAGVSPVLTVAPVDMDSPSAIAAEKFESVLVKVIGARADSVNTTTGEWKVYTEVGDTAVVNDWLFAYTPKFNDYYNVTGVVNGWLDNFKLEPRKLADITDVTDTKNGDLDGIEFKVYPNPFSNLIKIDNSDKLIRVVVSNIAGQRVIDVEYPNSEIRTDNLVSGIYVISLITESGIAKTEKIIKK